MKVTVNQLEKQYRKTKALANINFTLDGPKIYGLLGRNGSGKTTFMELLAGHILPSSGEVLVNDQNPFDNRQITEKICLIKEANNFHKELKIKEVLRTYALFYPNWDNDLAMRLIKVYKLDLNARVKSLSKGMVSALGVIVGLASKAPITIYDEPYIGLDAAARKTFYDTLIEEYEKEERMIIFSTHLIDEVSLLFEEVLILQEGELLLQENADELRNNAFAISGEAEQVKQFIQNKEVIKVEELAGMMTAYIYGYYEEGETAGLRVESVPIQELMIYLTEKEGA